MAGYRSDEDGATNNGFGRSLHQWEDRLLYAAGYMAPPDFRAPGGWRLSAGGIPIPPPPTGAALDAAIDEVIETMSDEQHADPRFYPDNRETWTAFFRRRYERELAAYDGPPPSPARNNAVGRRALVERARPHARVRPRAHRARQRPRPGDATAVASDALPPPRELLDATADGIRLLRVGDEVGITVLGIHAEDRQAGAVVCAAEEEQRRPRHPRWGARTAPSQAEEGRRCQGRV
jgi:hypothetical protein